MEKTPNKSPSVLDIETPNQGESLVLKHGDRTFYVDARLIQFHCGTIAKALNIDNGAEPSSPKSDASYCAVMSTAASTATTLDLSGYKPDTAEIKEAMSIVVPSEEEFAGTPGDALRDLLVFLYNRDETVKDSNVLPLLDIARYLDCAIVKNACAAHLCSLMMESRQPTAIVWPGSGDPGRYGRGQGFPWRTQDEAIGTVVQRALYSVAGYTSGSGSLRHLVPNPDYDDKPLHRLARSIQIAHEYNLDQTWEHIKAELVPDTSGNGTKTKDRMQILLKEILGSVSTSLSADAKLELLMCVL